jgi:hypothetical protein
MKSGKTGWSSIQRGLQQACGKNEPEYSTDLIKLEEKNDRD